DADGTPWRWTDGAALIPPSMLRDAVALEVTVAQRMPRWIAPETTSEIQVPPRPSGRSAA
ncbi:hypothetical protein, partial [Roseomonas elaeocarpi]